MYGLVCISHLRWDFVWQRPQHLLSRLAKHQQILFVEEPVSSTEATTPYIEILRPDHTPNVTVMRLIQPVEANRWIGHGDPLTQATYNRLLSKHLAQHHYHDGVLWLYTPMAAEFAGVIPHQLLVFDVMDQLSAFKGAPAELVSRDRALLRQADIVLTGGVSLYHDKKPNNPDTYLFPSGVEVEHFAKATHREHFPRPDGLKNIDEPILGYYGVIDERMDLSLIDYVARTRPDWNIVMIGPVVKIDPTELPQGPNLHYLGMKSYNELPAHLAYFDVALIPFALSEATRYLSPTKTLEYMAAHKPVVSTPIHDVIELYGKVVRVAETRESFVHQVQEALDEHPSTHASDRLELLNQHTWDRIAQQISDIMHMHLKRKSAASQKRVITASAGD
jgi:UDP-galactopyranose mutase